MQKILYVAIAILALIAGALGCVVHAQTQTLARQSDDLTQARRDATSLRAQLSEEHAAIEAAATRLDEAINQFVKGVQNAYETHKKRMQAVDSIEDIESVDWLCEPVPDDIRVLFGCADADPGDRNSDDDAQTAGGADAAMY